MVANKDIQKATLDYCVDNLKNKVTDPEAEEFMAMRNALVEEKIDKASGDTLEIDKEDFSVVLKRFQAKQTKSYDFLTKSGLNYQDAIFAFCKRIISEENIPVMFRRTILQMIWKMKGPKNVFWLWNLDELTRPEMT